jgi:hypothetical protein
LREVPYKFARVRPRIGVAYSSAPPGPLPMVGLAGGGATAAASVAAITRASINPVHRQVEALAAELNATPAATEENFVFEDIEMPEPAAMPEVAPVRAPQAPAYRAEPARPHPVAQKKQGLFGLFGRPKAASETRREPVPTQIAQPRASAQIITRIQPEPSARPAAAAATAQADDLFPEQKKDDQFEIPAFLRRQTN